MIDKFDYFSNYDRGIFGTPLTLLRYVDANLKKKKLHGNALCLLNSFIYNKTSNYLLLMRILIFLKFIKLDLDEIYTANQPCLSQCYVI